MLFSVVHWAQPFCTTILNFPNMHNFGRGCENAARLRILNSNAEYEGFEQAGMAKVVCILQSPI